MSAATGPLVRGVPVRVRAVVTPEGVPLPFQVATVAERIAAFGVDLLVIILLMGGLGLLMVLLAFATSFSPRAASIAVGVLFVIWFLITGLYFLVFELLWAGQTPGKRKLRLRVIARDGGPVHGEALLARNLTRDLEILLPLTLFVSPARAAAGAPEWVGWLAGAWAFALVLMPLFNRDHLRVGDLVGGTMVVREPRVVLMPDLGALPVSAAARGGTAEADGSGTAGGTAGGSPAADAPSEYAFTDAQLSSYGIYELQVLESVLQRADRERAEVLEVVAERIVRRIGWPERVPPAQCEAFLRAFYRAQRGRLERRMLFGERKERKG